MDNDSVSQNIFSWTFLLPRKEVKWEEMIFEKFKFFHIFLIKVILSVKSLATPTDKKV